MKVFHSPLSPLHAPEFYFRRGRRIPHFEQPKRYHVLKEAAERAGHEMLVAEPIGTDPILKVHTARYLQFLEEAYGRRDEVEPELDYILPSHFARPQMMRYPSEMIGRVGFHMADLSTPIHADSFTSVMASASVAVAGAASAAAGTDAYALCRPPGHHASAESAGGFCFLNNAAIAAEHIKSKLGCRVAILDVDVHHGNGTQSIFYDRDDVVTVSVHADPSNFMPYYAGYADERGEGKGEGYNLNLPLPHRSGDQVYLDAITSGLEFCRAKGVEAFVVALGLDASVSDPNGPMAVTTEGFSRAGQSIGSSQWPTVLVQEGGYLSDVLGDNLVAFLAGFESVQNR